jgi:hypothetical protein
MQLGKLPLSMEKTCDFSNLALFWHAGYNANL